MNSFADFLSYVFRMLEDIRTIFPSYDADKLAKLEALLEYVTDSGCDQLGDNSWPWYTLSAWAVSKHRRCFGCRKGHTKCISN